MYKQKTKTSKSNNMLGKIEEKKNRQLNRLPFRQVQVILIPHTKYICGGGGSHSPAVKHIISYFSQSVI